MCLLFRIRLFQVSVFDAPSFPVCLCEVPDIVFGYAGIGVELEFRSGMSETQFYDRTQSSKRMEIILSDMQRVCLM